MKLDFVKGHMGGNRIVLLYGDQVPNKQELEVAKVLDPLYLSGHQLGILYPPKGEGNLSVKIVELSQEFLTACGGLTQVLGKALIESKIGNHFGIKLQEPTTNVLLETDAGLTKIKIDITNKKVKRIVTSMDKFVEELYNTGVESIDLQGIKAMKVGKFFVLNGDKVKEKYPYVNFERMDEVTKNLLVKLQKIFQKKTNLPNEDFALYDWNPIFSGDIRAVFPHSIPDGHIEPACGTGTVAIGLGCLESGELKDNKDFQNGRIELQLETGGNLSLGGPDKTKLELFCEEEKLVKASFSHSLVELTASGVVYF